MDGICNWQFHNCQAVGSVKYRRHRPASAPNFTPFTLSTRGTRGPQLTKWYLASIVSSWGTTRPRHLDNYPIPPPPSTSHLDRDKEEHSSSSVSPTLLQHTLLQTSLPPGNMARGDDTHLTFSFFQASTSNQETNKSVINIFISACLSLKKYSFDSSL